MLQRTWVPTAHPVRRTAESIDRSTFILAATEHGAVIVGSNFSMASGCAIHRNMEKGVEALFYIIWRVGWASTGPVLFP